MTSITFLCNDGKLVTVDDDELMKCSARLEVDLRPEARLTRGRIALTISSKILVRVVQWARHSWLVRRAAGGLPNVTGNQIVFSDWEKRFLTASASMMAHLFHAALYLQIDQLHRTCSNWLIQMTFIAKPIIIPEGGGQVRATEFDNLDGMRIEEASEEVKAVGIRSFATQGVTNALNIKGIVGETPQIQELIKHLYLTTRTLDRDLERKNDENRLLKKTNEELVGQKLLLEKQVKDLLEEKAGQQRKDSNANATENSAKKFSQCVDCGAQFGSFDLLLAHLQHVHGFRRVPE